MTRDVGPCTCVAAPTSQPPAGRSNCAGILAAVQVVFASLRALHPIRSSGPIATATAKETTDKDHC